jgi:hypothetical protein
MQTCEHCKEPIKWDYNGAANWPYGWVHCNGDTSHYVCPTIRWRVTERRLAADPIGPYHMRTAFFHGSNKFRPYYRVNMTIS